jgi:aminopeptidase
MEDPRVRKLARFLIGYSVHLKREEKVLIEVHGDNIDLAKVLIDESYKLGAKPLIHLFNYQLERSLFMGIDEKHMEEITGYEMARMKNMDAYIDIRVAANLYQFNDIPQDKIEIYRKKYWAPLHLEQRFKNTKWAVLRYPNNSIAQFAGMSTEEYEDLYFKACLLDYNKMAMEMKKLVNRMDQTNKVKIVGPGTDLEFSIKGVPSIIGAGTNNVPDGEVYTAPLKYSVNGKIHYNCPSPYEGHMYNNIYLEFKDGKIVKATSNNTEKINKIFDSDEGARYIGEFALGVNPAIKHPIGDILLDEKISGSFHFTPGMSCVDINNANKSSIHWDLVCIQRPEYGGGEIFFDNVLIRKDGIFIPEELKGLNPENIV